MVDSRSRVIAVVVTHNGRPFLRDTFRGLAAQTRPIDDILVVDTGSTDSTADWARQRLGNDAVLAVRGQFGRAVMSAVRDERTAGMDWFWLLHDDSAPQPEALEHLLEEAETRPSAVILGPKLVGWADPRRLHEVGWSIDRTGRAVSPVEEDEIDQGQHDQVRDVFYVSTAGMLVRRTALVGAGGFDERMPAFRDDLDLCWRTHVLGGRVVIVPDAKVRHFGAAANRSRRTRAVNHPRYLSERHTMAALLKATSLRRLPLVLSLALVGGLVRMLGLTLTGRPGDALQILWAWGWNLKELPVTLVARRRLQGRRKLDDAALKPLRAPGGQRLRALLRALLDLIYGGEGEHVAQGPSVDEADLPQQGAPLLRVIASHPLAFGLAALALFMAVSLRGLLLAPGISGPGLAPFPVHAGSLLRAFAAAYHPAGLGSAQPAPPLWALLGAASVVAFGKTLLAEKLLLVLALPLAAATCTRALRLFEVPLAARAAAALLYATSPLAIGAVAQGRLGELAFLVLAPPTLAQVVLALRGDQPRELWRPALRFGLLAALSIAFYPAALVPLALLVAGAAIAAVVRAPVTDRRRIARMALLLGGGLALALVLLAPWTEVLFGAGSPLRDVGMPLASPTMLQLLELRPGGPGLPAAAVGPAYVVLGLAAVLFVPAARRRQAFWLLAFLVGAALLAAWQGSGLPGRFTDWPGGVLVLGAVAWAAAVGLGLGAIGPALAHRQLTWQRLAGGAVALLTLASGVLVVAHLGRGQWRPLVPVADRALPARVVASGTRVLWLAGRPGQGVSFAVTGPDARTVLDPGRVVTPAAAGALRQVVDDLLEARTHRAGEQLELFGIGYVAIRPGPQAQRLTDLVARQQDLQLQPSRQAAVFESDQQVAFGWWVAGDPPVAARQVVTGKPPVPLAGPLLGRGATVTGPATVVLPVPAGASWRATVGGAGVAPARALGWAQAFTVPAGVSGRLEVAQAGQRRRDVLLLVEGLLVLTALATMARPTRAAPPPPPASLADTTGDLRLTSLAQGGAR